MLPERCFETLIRRLWRDWSPHLDGSADIDRVLAALPDRAHRAAALNYYRAFAQPWRRSPRWAAEQRACRAAPRQPTLFLHGSMDGALLPEVAAGADADLSPGSRAVLINGGGHFRQLDRPEIVAAEIAAFVGDPPAIDHLLPT